MILGGYQRDWFLQIGPDFASNARFAVQFGFARATSAEPGTIGWLFYWSWSSHRLPRLLWRGWKPIGYCAFGRCRAWS